MGIEGFTCNLKQYRQQKDMTQEQLANAVGVRRGNHYASGKSPV